MKYIYAIILIFSISTQFCIGQGKIRGQIFDLNTNKPVAYASILAKNFGIISNETGNYFFILDSLNICDTVYFKCMGYIDFSISVGSLMNSKYQVYLEPKSYSIEEIKITANTKHEKIIELGNLNKRPKGWYYLSKSFQVALFIPNEKNRQKLIKSINFFVRDNGIKEKFFRIHLYERLSDNNLNELIPENLIISGVFKDEWVKVNLSKFNLKLPSDGLYVSIEALQEKNEIFYFEYFGKQKLKTKTISSIGMNWDRKNEDRTWLKGFYGTEWMQHEKRSNGHNGSAMIYIETLKHD